MSSILLNCGPVGRAQTIGCFFLSRFAFANAYRSFLVSHDGDCPGFSELYDERYIFSRVKSFLKYVPSKCSWPHDPNAVEDTNKVTPIDRKSVV